MPVRGRSRHDHEPAQQTRSAENPDVVFMLVDLDESSESIDDFLAEHRDDLFPFTYSYAFAGDSFERPTLELTRDETARFFRDIESAHATARAEREAPGYESRWDAVWALADAILKTTEPQALPT